MIKVLFVFNHPAPYKVKFLNELSKHIDLTVIFERDKNKDRNNEFYSEHKYNFKTVRIKAIKIGNENVFSNGVKNHIKKNKYDLIIMNGYSNLSELIAIKWMKRHHQEYALYINGGIINKDESNLKRNLKRKYISGAKFYFSPDERSNEYLVYYGAPKDKIFNYPYSTLYENELLDHKLSEEEKEKIRTKHNISHKNVYISCGQLIERKNYLELVKKWKDVDENSLLIIIGEGPQKEKIEETIKVNNSQNIRLVGYLSHKDMFELFHISSAFVFPSKEDIYGHVVNEALSQGLPVITLSNVNSGLHLIKNEYNGFIIENIDSQNFIDALNYVLSHDMFEACLATAKENTIEKMVEVNYKIIEENK